MSKRKGVTIREKTYDIVKQLADNEYRSVSKQLEYIVEKAINEEYAALHKKSNTPSECTSPASTTAR
ncbi:MAG: ribbon-helix-helix domain-containing protein [archaeon]